MWTDKKAMAVILALCFALCTLGVAEAADLKEVVFLVDGSYFGVGTAAEAVANFTATVNQKGTDAATVAQAKWQIGFVTKFSELYAASGYSIKGQDWGWGEPLIQKETNAFISKSGPDVIIGETQVPGFAARGYLEPFPAALEKKVRDLCVKGAYSPLEIGGKIYGIAAYPGVSALFWNKALLKNAGLDPEKAPADWDDWLSMANKITAAGKGAYWGGGTYAGPNFGGSLRLGPFMMMAGGAFVNAKNGVNFNSPGNIKAFEFIRALDKNTPTGIAGGPEEGPWWDAFTQQKIAFVVDGPWRLGQAQATGIDIGYSPLPKPKGGIDANVTIGACFYAVPKYAKNKDGGFKFLETLIDPALQQMIAVSNTRSPVLKSFGKDKAFMSSYIATFYNGIQGTVAGLPTFNGEQNSKIWDVFHQSMTRSIVTSESISEILKSAQSTAEKLQ